jgi:hypothetical protein
VAVPRAVDKELPERLVGSVEAEAGQSDHSANQEGNKLDEQSANNIARQQVRVDDDNCIANRSREQSCTIMDILFALRQAHF